jgi:hypothetical protein
VLPLPGTATADQLDLRRNNTSGISRATGRPWCPACQHWSAACTACGYHDPDLVPARAIRVGRERVRAILHQHDISFQRTRTWKTSTDPDYDAKLNRIEEVMSRFR